MSTELLTQSGEGAINRTLLYSTPQKKACQAFDKGVFCCYTCFSMLPSMLKAVTGIIYPLHCLNCRQKLEPAGNNYFICQSCLKKIIPSTPPFCRETVRERLYFDRAVSACAYEGIIQKIIHSFKYRHKIKLGGFLAGLMLDFIREYHLPLTQCDCIIPVPLSLTRLREREFNQAQIIAAQISESLQIPLLNNALTRVRHSRPQVELSREERLNNLKGAFAAEDKKVLTGKDILLIDDVLTTGATASEAARALKEAGANSVFVFTAAGELI